MIQKVAEKNMRQYKTHLIEEKELQVSPKRQFIQKGDNFISKCFCPIDGITVPRPHRLTWTSSAQLSIILRLIKYRGI